MPMTGNRMYKLKESDYWFYCEWKNTKHKSKYRKAFAKRINKFYRQEWKRELMSGELYV